MRGKEKFKYLIDKDGYILHDKFNNCNEYVEVTHIDCGNRYSVQVVAFNKGRRCPKCAKNLKLTTNDFQNIISKRGFKLLSEYKNMNTKVLVKHIECGNEWMVNPSKMIHLNRGCPECKLSHGEEFIRMYLKNNNINYIKEKRFNDCRNTLPLPFDFYIPYYNIVIEYHGKQHYKRIDFFGGDEGFNQRKVNDKIKKDYCIKKGIKYIELDYTLNNYEKVENKLKEVFTDV
ncbi:hypothetical protein vBSscSF1_39 [Staphylococcus phage vB-SscS-F1]|nr:hypothetical protein vBApySJF1_39 [Arcanobacterium phage vB-ApyS-JF1]